ncbi:MAG: N-acetyltransferase [Candidatus Lokiarchaeota archaeon]|nr:N-acetyltransferase [Candidatus Lokiarchaeota archaeon]
MENKLNEILQTRRLTLQPVQNINLKELKEVINIHEVFATIINSTLKFTQNSFANIQNLLNFEIIEKNGEIIIGFCGLFFFNTTGANCYYYLSPQYRGNGYAIEAMKKVLEFAFMKLKLSNINSYIHSENQNAWKVAERIGMMYMGDLVNETTNRKIMVFLIEKPDFVNQGFY